MAKSRPEAGGGEGRSDSDDIGAVLFFLRGAAEADIYFNGTSGRQGFDAFARLLGEDPADLWKRTGKE